MFEFVKHYHIYFVEFLFEFRSNMLDFELVHLQNLIELYIYFLIHLFVFGKLYLIHFGLY